MRKVRVQIVNIAGVEGKGPTKKEAREDAERQIRYAVEGDYTPSALSFRGRTMLVWRSIGGYCSAFVYPEHQGDIGAICYHSSVDSKQKVLQSCKLSLAELGWNGVEEGSPYLDNAADQDDFRRWVRFQQAYAVAREQGLGDSDAHRAACAA